MKLCVKVNVVLVCAVLLQPLKLRKTQTASEEPEANR